MKKKTAAKEQPPDAEEQTQRQVVKTIRILMIDKDMRPADLARKMEVTRSYIGQLLSGRSRILNVKTLHRIAEATDTVLDVQFRTKIGPNG